MNDILIAIESVYTDDIFRFNLFTQEAQLSILKEIANEKTETTKPTTRRLYFLYLYCSNKLDCLIL